MAHLIDMSNGRANMAYTGKKPWHGLGYQLQPGAGLDQWREAAGLNYDVVRAPVQYQNGILRQFTGRDVLYRSDTSAALGIVSSGYKIVQPGEVLEFFRDLCDRQNMQIETAGVLKGGALYWALAKTGHSLNMGDGDVTDGYCLMSTSADGTRATDNRLTSVRVVCNNTLTAATHSGRGAIRTSHRQRFDADATKGKMGLVSHYTEWQNFKSSMESLAAKPVTRSDATGFFVDLLRPATNKRTAKPDERAAGAEWLNNLIEGQNVLQEIAVSDRAVRGLAELENSYYRAPGAAPGTAYGLVQGVTHYIDHVRGASGDKRLTSAWFGQGEILKNRALETALTM